MRHPKPSINIKRVRKLDQRRTGAIASKYRISKGVSQKALAAKIQVSQAMISKLETGRDCVDAWTDSTFKLYLDAVDALLNNKHHAQ